MRRNSLCGDGWTEMNNVTTCNFSNCIFHLFLDIIACAVYKLLARAAAFRSFFINFFPYPGGSPSSLAVSFLFPSRGGCPLSFLLCFLHFSTFAVASPLPHAHFHSPTNVLVAALHYSNVIVSLRTNDRPHRPLYNNTPTCCQHSGTSSLSRNVGN